MGYPKLSKAPVAAEYIKLEGKKALFNGRVVEVFHVETSNQVGSYERGIAWNRTTYGIICKNRTRNTITVSADHGVTWHKVDNWEKERVLRWTRKGRVKLFHNLDKELAFNQIQEINRRWEGPGYRWKP